MQYGDVRFLGVGPHGEPVTVGVEVKSLGDILHCITDGRFAGHQLPGMVTTYDQPWLLISGQWRSQRGSGLLQYFTRHGSWRDASVGSRRFMYRDLLSWMLTIRTKTGILVQEVPDWEHAATWIASLYSWWTKVKRIGGEEVTGWESHRSHLAVNQASNEQFWQRVKQEEREEREERKEREEREERDHAHVPGANGNNVNRVAMPNGAGVGRSRLTDRANLLRPTVCRLVAAQLPGVGYTRSEEVARRFPTVERLVAATVKELQEVDGVGKAGAKKIWEALHA
jgi:hypothetical protein